jgi:hypothetical protein
LGYELRLLENVLWRECGSDTWRDFIGFDGERTVTGGGFRIAIGGMEIVK